MLPVELRWHTIEQVSWPGGKCEVDYRGSQSWYQTITTSPFTFSVPWPTKLSSWGLSDYDTTIKTMYSNFQISDFVFMNIIHDHHLIIMTHLSRHIMYHPVYSTTSKDNFHYSLNLIKCTCWRWSTAEKFILSHVSHSDNIIIEIHGAE